VSLWMQAACCKANSNRGVARGYESSGYTGEPFGCYHDGDGSESRVTAS
jgi:hypothetical protein